MAKRRKPDSKRARHEPVYLERDITKTFLSLVEKHRNQLQKPPQHQKLSRSPTGGSSSNSDNPLEIFSAEIRENIGVIAEHISDLEKINRSGLITRKFETTAETIHNSIKHCKEDIQEFDRLCHDRKQKGASLDNKRYLERMSKTISNLMNVEAKRFRNVLLARQKKLSREEAHFAGVGPRSPTSAGRDTGLHRRTTRRRRPGPAEVRRRHMQESDNASYDPKAKQDQSLMRRHSQVNVTYLAKMVSEITQVMTQISEQVAQQGQMVTRIEDNIFDVNTNVSEGHGYLLDYLQGIQGNRSLIIKIFIFLICSLFLFVYILRS